MTMCQPARQHGALEDLRSTRTILQAGAVAE
jgi:hypothetical protein